MHSINSHCTVGPSQTVSVQYQCNYYYFWDRIQRKLYFGIGHKYLSFQTFMTFQFVYNISENDAPFRYSSDAVKVVFYYFYVVPSDREHS